MLSRLPFTIANLRQLFREGRASPLDVAREALRRAREDVHPHVWITLLREDVVLDFANRLEAADFEKLPLYGVPFAIKDNIDLACVPTTVGCPSFSFTPERSATVVERLIAAGAIPIGKTNMDQFATGLVGTRTPYGACASVFNSEYISGGSSSGSAVAVAAGIVAFSLGTDTAGSGRVPAAFNQIVGLKPSLGVISTRGVFPACRSLDCVSIFAGSCFDADAVFDIAAGFDAQDPFSRELSTKALPRAPRVGVPDPNQLEFFGDKAAEALFRQTIDRMGDLGMVSVEVDFSPFRDVAKLLYQGPWVAERRHALGDFLDTHGGSMDPTVLSIIAGAERFTAVDAFAAQYQLTELRARAKAEWSKMDVLLLPTTGTIYKHTQVQESPVALNSNLGVYTNFVNLLDLSAVAVPAGLRPSGLPFGVTLIAPSFHDRALLAIGDQFHKSSGGTLGKTTAAAIDQPEVQPPKVRDVLLAVVGAHLSGQPLNAQLTSRGARLVRTTRTSLHYQLYALANTVPPKPGLVRRARPVGDGIEVEIWSLSEEAFGSFVADVPPPMVIGTITLSNGTSVKGFLCEPSAIDGAEDITATGGWRKYLSRK